MSDMDNIAIPEANLFNVELEVTWLFNSNTKQNVNKRIRHIIIFSIIL